jgi:hypothetical protein
VFLVTDPSCLGCIELCKTFPLVFVLRSPCRVTPALQIQFLEVRLAEVMAYADIPPSLRPALSEFDPLTAAGGVAPLPMAGLLAQPKADGAEGGRGAGAR